MKKLIAVLALMYASNVNAQAPANDFSNLSSWISTQQINAGTALDLKGKFHGVAYWKFASTGPQGFRQGSASSSYVDIGLGGNWQQGQTPQLFVPVLLNPVNILAAWGHVLPASVHDHTKFGPLPPIEIGPAFVIPANGTLGKWTWQNDILIVASLKFP